MKVALLGGGNPHSLALARHLHSLSIECFGIGRAGPKPAPLWLVPEGYRYYVAHLGEQLPLAMEILDSERPDVIVNFAAQGEGAASFGADAWRFYQTNCVTLVRLVEELRKRDYVRRFVQISTSELYGSCERPVAEDAPIRATSPYSISKAAFDAHLQMMHRVHGFPMQIVRPSNCYTPGMQLHRILARAAVCAVYGKKLQLQGGGLARKTYMHSDDLARAIMTVIERGAIGETYNAGAPLPITIRDLVDHVRYLSRLSWEQFAEEAPGRSGEDSQYWLDSAKLRALGWAPEILLRDGIEHMLSWVRQFPQLADMPHEFVMRP